MFCSVPAGMLDRMVGIVVFVSFFFGSFVVELFRSGELNETGCEGVGESSRFRVIGVVCGRR